MFNLLSLRDDSEPDINADALTAAGLLPKEQQKTLIENCKNCENMS